MNTTDGRKKVTCNNIIFFINYIFIVFLFLSNFGTVLYRAMSLSGVVVGILSVWATCADTIKETAIISKCVGVSHQRGLLLLLELAEILYTVDTFECLEFI